MTENLDYPPQPYSALNSIPGWIAAGALGIVIGAGGTILGMRGYGYRFAQLSGIEPASHEAAADARLNAMPSGGMANVGGGGPPMMGMGGMGGGGGGFGGGKRNLTSLVGKLELLSRPGLDLRLEFDAEQAKNLAVKLGDLDEIENLTVDDAQAWVEELEILLTTEQKDTLGLVGLPFSRPGGGNRGAAGGPGGGGPPQMGMMGMGGGPPDENPFKQEVNAKRLRDLLGRLAPASPDPESASPGPRGTQGPSR